MLITKISILVMHVLSSQLMDLENRGIQSNQCVHVHGIWWIGVFVVFVANLYFFKNDSLLKLFQERHGLSLFSFFSQGGGHLVPIVLIIGTLVHLLLHFLLLYFCIATCIP